MVARPLHAGGGRGRSFGAPDRAAIIPCSVSASRRLSFEAGIDSWWFALYARRVRLGRTDSVPREATDTDVETETIRLEVERAINRVTIEADARMGHNAPIPDGAAT